MIDVTFSFLTDTPQGKDPDSYSPTLKRYHQILWSKMLPKHCNSLNQMRGMNGKIADRWDLTMECIRRYYNGEDSPLSKWLKRDKAFFDLFVDFKGYVEFFLLQDCVSDDFSSVDIWCGDATFEQSGWPKTVDEYYQLIHGEYAFLDKRNERIREYCWENGM